MLVSQQRSGNRKRQHRNHDVPPQRQVPLAGFAGSPRARSPLGCIFPQCEGLLGRRRQVGLATIRVHGHSLEPGGPVNLVEACLGELNILRAGPCSRDSARAPWGSITSTEAPFALESRNSAKDPPGTPAGPASKRPRYRAACSTKGTNEACSGKSFATLSNVEVKIRIRPWPAC